MADPFIGKFQDIFGFDAGRESNFDFFRSFTENLTARRIFQIEVRMLFQQRFLKMIY